MKPRYVVLCVLLALGAVKLYGWSERRTGRNEGRLEAQVEQTSQLAKAVAQRDTEYVKKTDTLRRVLRQYDSVRVTDTLPVVVTVPGKPDTVEIFIPRSVADTAVAVCLQVVHSCESRVAARDTLITGLRAQLSLQRKAKPSKLSRILNHALWLGAGYGIGRLTGR